MDMTVYLQNIVRNFSRYNKYGIGKKVEARHMRKILLLTILFSMMNMTAVMADFRDNGDGTVSDTATGLMWQKATHGRVNWEAAITYCETLTHASYDDWRLPNRNELQSLVDYSRYPGPVIDISFPPGTVGSVYWSSTTYAYSSENAWYVEFSSGAPSIQIKSYTYYVRAVRAGQCVGLDHLYIYKPAQGATWAVGTVQPITWDTKRIQGNVKISLSREGGKPDTFETLAEATPNDGAFQWNVFGPASANCMLRIDPLLAGYTDKGATQGLFSIEINTYSQQDTSLFGTVLDKTTSGKIGNATVQIQSVTSATDANGYFSFSELTAGTHTLTVNKTGYFTASKTVTISDASTASMNILLIPETTNNKPVITDVQGDYFKPEKDTQYFLDGIDLYETLTVKVNWRGQPPGTVHWITPSNTFVDTASGSEVSRSFNMGTDFGEGGTLKVKAVSNSGTEESVEFPVNFAVIPQPPFASLLPEVYYVPVPKNKGFEYKFMGIDSFSLDLATWAPSNIDTSFPIFGGAEMKIGLDLGSIGDDSLTLSGLIDSNGKASLFTYGIDGKTKKTIRKGVLCRKGIKLPFIEAKPNATIDFQQNWSDDLERWTPGGELGVGCDFTFASPSVSVASAFGIPIYLRSELDLDLLLTLGIDGWTHAGPEYTGQFEFEPLVKGILGAGLAKKLCVEGYAGGGFHSGIEFLPQTEWIDPYAVLVGGAQVIAGPFRQGIDLEFKWPEQAATSLSLNSMIRSDNYSLIPRDYLIRTMPASVSTSTPLITTAAITEENIIASNIFPYSVPDTAQINDAALAVWVADNTSRNLINRTEVRYTTYESGTWSSSLPIADDGTADMNPRAISIPGGNAACIWQDADMALPDSDDFDTFNSHIEISASSFDAASGTWSAPSRLTDNATLDHSPNLSAAGSDDMMAVWVNNEFNDYFGSVSMPNTLMWSHYNGTTWSAAASIASGVGTILGTAMEYDGSNATFVYCVDMDDNLDTSTDTELWRVTYSGGVWGTPQRLTNDAIADANPRLAYDGNGILRLAWLKGNDIRFATGTDVAGSVVVATPGESLNSKDFNLVMGDSGNIALVWNDVSETYSDIWMACYDGAMSVWSRPRQLTHDADSERFISGVLNPDGNLLCVFDKNHTIFEDQQETVNGRTVLVQGVPKAGQSDLSYLIYTMDTDLSVTVEDVNITPLKALPGIAATITAKIKNLGEAPASDIDVAFYQCDPEGVCTAINSIQTITEPLAGGAETEVSVPWTVPALENVSMIRVDVDPNLNQDDRDRTNNRVEIPATKPDFVVQDISVQSVGSCRFINIRVGNEGSVTGSNVTVSIHRGSANGELLNMVSVPEIQPGAYKEISYIWDNPSLPGESRIEIFGVVDETGAIDEFDEGNNIGSAYAAVAGPPELENISVSKSCISELGSSAIHAIATDPAMGALSYTWEPLDGGEITGEGVDVVFDPPDSGPHACPYRVKVTVTSSVSGLSAEETVEISVKLAGDVNGDGIVNIIDKVMVRDAFGQSGEPGSIAADVNLDGVVNIIDKVIVRNQFGQSGCACPR